MASTEIDGVTTRIDRNTVSATTIVGAAPADVFEYIRRPANHAEINGDGSVREVNGGPERLELGSRFGMKMKLGVPYRIHSKVVEFEQDRLIAWSHIGGHRWRWQLDDDGDGTTRLTETFDMATAKFPPALRIAGYPRRHTDNVSRSVANVAAHFA